MKVIYNTDLKSTTETHKAQHHMHTFQLSGKVNRQTLQCLPQPCLGRSFTHHYETCLGVLYQHMAQPIEFLFYSDAAHIEKQGSIGVAVGELCTGGVVAVLGVKYLITC